MLYMCAGEKQCSAINSVQSWRVHQHEDVIGVTYSRYPATALVSGLGWASNVLLHLDIHFMLCQWMFSCTCTDTSCYASGCSLALAHTRHAMPVDVLLYLHRHVMLCQWMFSCTCTDTSCFWMKKSIFVILAFLALQHDKQKHCTYQVKHTILTHFTRVLYHCTKVRLVLLLHRKSNAITQKPWCGVRICKGQQANMHW